MSSGDIWLVTVPWSQFRASDRGHRVYVHGAKLVLLDSTRPEDVCSTLQKEKATFMPIVPSLLKRIVDLENLKDYDLSSLQKVSAGGKRAPPS